MPHRPRLVRPPSRGFTRRGEHGFTLLEFSIVLFIISIVAAFAVPAGRRLLLNARSAAAINDLRVFSAAFQAYAHDRGNWPDAAAPGEVPPDMQTYLAASNWTRVTPIGGHYTWARNTLQQGERYHAAIVFSATSDARPSDDRQQLKNLDKQIDDGDLATGNFRLGYRDQPVFVIEH